MKIIILFICFLLLYIFSLNSSIEKMENLGDSFCEFYGSKPHELELETHKLTFGNCIKNRCTVWANNKCLAGGKNGPTYKTENGGKDKIKITDYYYMNQYIKI